MAVTQAESASTGKAAAEPLAAGYARKATGLVREVPALDAMFFNAAASGSGVGIAVAVGLFVVLTQFPRANLVLALIIALALCLFVWVTYALLSATFPRTGGDYLYGSRIFHPVVGLAINMGTYASTVLSAGVIAYLLPVAGLAPIFAIIGEVSGNRWWLATSSMVAQKGWVFAIAAGVLVIVAVLSAVGTKFAARASTIAMSIALAGYLITFVVLVFKSHAGFVHDLNAFSRPFTHDSNTYDTTIRAGAAHGLTYPSQTGYSTKSTIGALIVTIGVIYPAVWSAYLAGEMKGAGRRRRQLAVMIGSGTAQTLLIILSVAIFLHVVGYNFYAAATAGSYPVAVPPYANFFAALALHSTVITVVCGLTFMLWFFPACFTQLAMCQRALFAWAFDGVIPRTFAAVHPRTHTPLVAIAVSTIGALGAAAWATFSSSFFQVLASLLLLGIVAPLVVGVGAALLPWIRPTLYRGSPAAWQPWGIPALVVSGVICAGVGGLMVYLITYFYKVEGLSSRWVGFAILGGVVLTAVTVYAVARTVQRRRGIDLTLVYKTIPPD